jgi:hypothetical protein
VKLDAERMQGVVFAIIPLTFNKLRDANGFTVPDGTRCRAKGSSGLAFSVASEDDQIPLFSVAAATRVSTCSLRFCCRWRCLSALARASIMAP